MAAAPPNLDFRAPADDAWYAVRLAVGGEAVLRVMYCNFSADFDELYSADQFAGPDELEEFKERFRPSSLQLQDEECRKLVEGMEVCASYTFSENDIRFYDAIVESVRPSEHITVNGEAICNCAFEVLWQHGPLAGEKTVTGVQEICIVHSRRTQNPTLDRFLNIARKRFSAKSMPTKDNTGKATNENIVPVSDTNDKFKRILNQSTDSVRSSPKPGPPEKGCCILWIDNLEKDLSPITVMDFIYEQTSMPSQVEFSHSILPVMRNIGKILVKNEQHAKKLLDFLLDPAHIVVSSKGRPWFVREDWCQKFIGAVPRYEKKKGSKSQQDSSKLRLAYNGTKEYERAKELQSLRREFHDHLERLHQRLESEERKLICFG